MLKQYIILIISSLLISSAFSQDNKELKFLEEVFEVVEDTLYEFKEEGKQIIESLSTLGAANLKAGGKVVIDELNCDSSLKFTNGKVKVNPDSIPKGGSADIKVQGISSVDVNISKLDIIAYLNDEKAYETTDNIKGLAEAGKDFVYEYKAKIPSFVPTGHFVIYLSLISDSNEKLSCMKVSFDF